jgi:hypothetical protein
MDKTKMIKFAIKFLTVALFLAALGAAWNQTARAEDGSKGNKGVRATHLTRGNKAGEKGVAP